MSDTAEPARLFCPRCGYDLQGETSQWQSACPIRGRCVECGLEFDWVDLFRHARHPWLFESQWAEGSRRRFVLTILHAFRPRRFWSSVRMEDPIRLRPAATCIIVLIVLTFIIASGFRTYGEATTFAGWWYLWPHDLTGLFWIDITLASVVVMARLGVTMLGVPAAILLGMPLAFAMIPVTLKRAKVRRRHIVRIGLYSLIVPIVIAIAWFIEQGVLLVAGELVLRDLTNPWMMHYALPWRVRDDWMFARRFIPAVIMGLPLLIWVWMWWHAALTRYLKLPRAGRILLVLLGTVTLLAVVVETWMRVML